MAGLSVESAAPPAISYIELTDEALKAWTASLGMLKVSIPEIKNTGLMDAQGTYTANWKVSQIWQAYAKFDLGFLD